MNAFFRRVRAIASKELRHLLRDPKTLLIVFAQPVMLMMIYGNVLSLDLRRIKIAVWDQDRSVASRQLVDRLTSGGERQLFSVVGYINGPDQIEPLLSADKARFVLVIPTGFGADLGAGRTGTVQALFDAAESNTAGVASGYLTAAVGRHNARLAISTVSRRRGLHPGGPVYQRVAVGEAPLSDPIELRWRVFYNPALSSVRYVVPGLMAILLTFLAATLTSTSIVRERELGPMESLFTSPVSATELVIGKLAPYVLVAVGDILLVLLVGGVVFGVWPRGAPFALVSFSFLFLLAMLAIGMLISAQAESQQTALLFAILVTMLPNMFLTGFAFPRSNMPWILQQISLLLPATHYLIAIRGVFLKGTGWEVHWPQGLWMAVVSAILITLAIRVVRQTMQRGLA